MIAARALFLLLLGAPVLIGAGLTLGTALGWQPGIGRFDLGWQGFAQAVALPGFASSLRLTLITGIGATLGSLAVSVPLGLWLVGKSGAVRFLTPLLAVPHAALAIGLAFLLAPSGWAVRLISPWATGWDLPPAVITVGDPWGFTLILGLMLKEVPFLVLATLVAAGTRDIAGQMAAGRALGYPPGQVWRLMIWPQLYPALRLPVLIVLGFSLSVVDMALVLGPSNPPVMAVQILRLFGAPDPAMAQPASAMAVILLGVMALSLLAWLAGERAIAALGRIWLRQGRRGRRGAQLAGPFMAIIGVVLGLGALGALLLWSVATFWRFPNALPSGFSGRLWGSADWLAPALSTLGLALASGTIALCLSLFWLEIEDRTQRRLHLGWLIALPLLLPQIGFLQGLTTGFLWLGLPPGPLAVIWAQLLFVFPYVMIALTGPWRALDPALLATAASLGAGPTRRFFAVKVPMLAAPIATAVAIGIAVSVAQYLAVLLPGAGRVRVLATEAVALASGADRRLAAIMALMQAALPLIGYLLALTLPLWLHRNRRGLRGGAT
ncbi:ABC transporter permease [Thioclava sp. 15-R06ZXC-3]|uniref:ABC transporter permease n=1 Tax=Thioclava arctica TaxID=3238301 RepID=A0ABV3TIN6_9RHOB